MRILRGGSVRGAVAGLRALVAHGPGRERGPALARESELRVEAIAEPFRVDDRLPELHPGWAQIPLIWQAVSRFQGCSGTGIILLGSTPSRWKASACSGVGWAMIVKGWFGWPGRVASLQAEILKHGAQAVGGQAGFGGLGCGLPLCPLGYFGLLHGCCPTTHGSARWFPKRHHPVTERKPGNGVGSGKS